MTVAVDMERTSVLSTVQGVLLDAGGVMAIPQPEQLSKVVGKFGGADDEQTLVRAHYEAMTRADSLRGFDWPTYHHELLVCCGVPDSVTDACAEAMAVAVATVPDWWSFPLPGAREALRTLTGLLPVGVVSNSDGTAEHILSKLGMCQLGAGPAASVLVIVDSAVVGVDKPDPRIFAPAVAALGLPASSVAYVGDTLAFDVAGARAASLIPVHVDPFGFCALREDHAHVTGLPELVEALKPLRA